MVAIGTISYLGSHGAELLRAGWTEAVLDPELEDWAGGSTNSGARPTPPSFAAAACGSRTRARSSRSTGAARPDEDAARAVIDAIAARRRGGRPAHPLGAQGARGAPAGADRQGRRDQRRSCEGEDVDVAMYVGDDTTDLDAFRSLVQLVEEGRLSRAIRSACAPTRARGDHQRGRHRRRRNRRRA